ncbi:MAG TPA: aminotransferase class I/II-fold pyridoxal phosphate-dependent enzyme, partial [Chitinophagaceae bacterium]
VLRQAMADWYKKYYQVALNPDSEILPLIGSKEGIMHICMTYVNEGDIVLVPDPGYPTYRSAAKLAGGKVIDYVLKEENDWFPDLDSIKQQLKKEGVTAGCLMFVNYPHMPTGQLPTREMFDKLIAFAKDNSVLLVHDNPYSFILNDEPLSLLSINGAKDVAIELNSLSKSHNMAGWRIGMLSGAKQRIDEVLRFKSNMDSGMFLPVQLAAAKALSLGDEWFQQLNDIYRKRRIKVFELLNVLNCTYDEKQAGLFVWAAIPEGYKDSYELSDEVLYQKNVFITPGGIFGQAGLKYIRISLCSPEARLTEAMKRVSGLEVNAPVNQP